MFVSEIFNKRTKRKYTYNITAIDNIPSIIKNGILCYDAAKKLPHSSIAINDVQARRDRVIIPNGIVCIGTRIFILTIIIPCCISAKIWLKKYAS